MSAPSEPSAETVLELIRALFHARDPHTLVQQLVRFVPAVIPVDCAFLSLLLPSGSAARVFTACVSPGLEMPPGPRTVEGTTVGHVLETGASYCSELRADGEPRFSDETVYRDMGLSSMAIVPLRAPDQPLGAVRFGRVAPPAFDDRELAALTRMSQAVAWCLPQILEREHTQRFVTRERALLEMCRVATEARSPGDVFDAMAEQLGLAFPCDRAVIIEVRGDMAHPILLRAVDPVTAPIPPPYEWRGSPIESVIQERRARIHEISLLKFPTSSQLIQAGLRTAMVAPIIVEGRVYAIFAASSCNPDAFAPEDLDLFTRASQLFGLALENARAHEENSRLAARERQMQELSVALTGHSNPRDLLDPFDRLLRRVVPYDWAMAFELLKGELVPLGSNAPDAAREALYRRHALNGSPFLEAVRARVPIAPQPGPGSPFRWLFENDYGSALVLPVVLESRALGVLLLASRAEQAFPEQDIQLLSRAARQFAVAIQGARSFEEIQRLAQRERDLLEIANALTSYRSPEDMFPAMVEALRGLVRFDSSILFAVDGDWLHAIAAGTPGEWDASLGQPRLWAESSAREAIQNRQPTRHVISDLQTTGRERMLELGLQVLVHVPVVDEAGVQAVLAIASRSPDGLPPPEVAIVARAAQQFAVGLQNARAHAENRRLARRERDLLELTNAMTLHRNPQDILEHMLPALGRVVRLEPGDLAAVFDVEGDVLRPAAVNDPKFRAGPAWRAIHWPGQSIEPMLRSGNFRRMSVEDDSCPAGPELREGGYRTLLCLPLMIQGAPVGLFWLASVREDAFAGEELDTLARVAQQFGLALEGGRSFREIQAREQRLELENLYLKEELSETAGTEMVGVGPAVASVRELVRKVARTDTAVLIRGESGTGKELVAEAVHRMSTRADEPLIKVNCASLPESLIGSELFGHEKGAFTGAVAMRLGRFEMARGGTIFLDEIGELSPEVQVKLLRVLQEGEFERVGSSTTLRTDARVIAATNRHLERAVAQGRFREDLFYRLNVFPITIPPLRQRPEDILVLAYYFLHRLSRKLGKNITRLLASSEAWMLSYAWPGNVRELQNLIERAVILSDGGELRVEPLAGSGEAALEDVAPPVAAAVSPDTLAEAERRHILTALRRTGGRVAGPGGAAEMLGIKRTTLNSRMKKLGITRGETLQ